MLFASTVPLMTQKNTRWPGPICSMWPWSVIAAVVAMTLLSALGRNLEAQARPRARNAGAATAALETAAPTKAGLRVVIALVLPDMTVRPVPLHALVVSDASTNGAFVESDSAGTLRSESVLSLRTGLDGSATMMLPVGRYLLKSVQPAARPDSLFSWELHVEVTADGATVELTNANAKATPAPRAAAALRQVAPEREVFERVKRAVFRIEAGLGHGSGFLVRLPEAPEHASAYVVTNDHVIGTSATASVYLDSVTRVPAQVVIRDREADLAVLRISAARCQDCPRLDLANPQGDEALVVAGERLLAIGFPLSQEMTLTTGIASSVRAGAILSDVNINPGNSGGPLLAMSGEVVGINTFGDQSENVGPGIGGAVAVTRLYPLLARVPDAVRALGTIEDRQLPTVPTSAYPLALIRQQADLVAPRDYRKLLERRAGRFIVSVTTPVAYEVVRRAAEAEVAGDRRKREAQNNVARDEQYGEANQSRDWEQYVGAPTTPVVAVAIVPQVGETGGSMFARALVAGMTGAQMQAKYVFRGDVRGARFYRNGVEVEPIRGGHGPQVVRVENQWIALKDVADMGYYLLAPETFRPDADGSPAVVTVVIQDLKSPDVLSTMDIADQTSARVWNDFEAYFRSTKSGEPWVAASSRLKSPKIGMNCVARTGECSASPR